MPTATLPSRTIIEVPLNKITGEMSGNVRSEYDTAELDELAESIAVHGLIQPLTVVGGPDVEGGDGNYAVYIGHRRYRALQILKDAKRIKATQSIPVIVDNDVIDLASDTGLGSTAVARMLIENLQRVDISALDEARGYAVMTEQHHYTQRELADAVGKSPGHIAKRLALLTLPTEVQEMVGHQIGLDDAYELSKLDDDQIRKIAKQAATGRSIEWDLKNAQATKERRVRAEKLKAFLDKQMIEVLPELPADIPREQLDHIGWFDLERLKAHDLKKNQLVVKGNTNPMTEVNIWRKLTAAQAAKAAEQAAAEQEQRDAQRAAAAEQEAAEYAEYLATEASPYERWEAECDELRETWYEQRSAWVESIHAHIGQHLQDLAPRDAGKIAVAMVAARSVSQAKMTCDRLGLAVPTEDEAGEPIPSWQRDYKSAIQEWVGQDTGRAVIAWIAGQVDVADIDLDVFTDFRQTLIDQGVVAPVEPEYPPEPVDEDDQEDELIDA